MLQDYPNATPFGNAAAERKNFPLPFRHIAGIDLRRRFC
jgi:hypothetical protein